MSLRLQPERQRKGKVGGEGGRRECGGAMRAISVKWHSMAFDHLILFFVILFYLTFKSVRRIRTHFLNIRYWRTGYSKLNVSISEFGKLVYVSMATYEKDRN